MNKIKNENGIALVTALMFTLITLGMVMMLLYVVTQGTKTTAANKRYKTSLEASYGAVELLQKDIIPRMMNFSSASSGVAGIQAMNFPGLMTTITSAKADCLYQKLNKTSWDSAKCDGTTKSTVASVSPDITFNLKATNDPLGYNVYTKIVDTRCGGTSSDPCSNSDPNSGGIKGIEQGGTGTVAEKTAVGKPAYYRIEVKGERAGNPVEKSEISVLYAY